MRILSLDWPHLPLRLALGREPRADELVVLGGHAWDQGEVLDQSPAAAGLGVRRGQPLGKAHLLAPEAVFMPVDPRAYTTALEAALDALDGLAPAIESETDPTARSFGRILVGIEGLARLWGEESALVARALALLAPFVPGRPRSGIGNTRFGAAVAAVVGAGIVPVGGHAEEAAFLAPLPIGLLPADAAVRDRFRMLGLATIGQLAALDRSAVIARFGQMGGELHDLARGLDRRPLRPRRPVERLHAEVELEPAVDSLEPLRFVLHHLCGVLCEQLAARGAGAGRAALLLALEPRTIGADPVMLRYDQALPEPAAAPDLLERLLMARLEAAPPTASVERLSLELDGAAPVAGRQLTLFSPQLARAGRLDWQLASLAIRFGPDRILRPRLDAPDALLADRRVTWLRAMEG